jgi:hypothetical protein
VDADVLEEPRSSIFREKVCLKFCMNLLVPDKNKVGRLQFVVGYIYCNCCMHSACLYSECSYLFPVPLINMLSVQFLYGHLSVI